MSRKGILLINLGTPASPGVKDVRRFLRAFLSDPYVMDIPAPLRYLLLYGFILPFRPRQTAKAYRAIWTKAGSPLLVHSQQLRDELALQCGNDYLVALGMRYSEPSIAEAWRALVDEGCQDITVLPLFPQYSLATTESCLQQVRQLAKNSRSDIKINYIQNFYKQPCYTGSCANLINQVLKKNSQITHVLMSFHGLPIRQVAKVEKSGKACDQGRPCGAITEANQDCYRAQCYASAAAIASALYLRDRDYNVSFQSRLGKNPWIAPATEDVMAELVGQGILHIVVACPSFVADCVETLEEIDIRARAKWQQLGGKTFEIVPCLNASSLWVQGLQQWLAPPIKPDPS